MQWPITMLADGLLILAPPLDAGAWDTSRSLIPSPLFSGAELAESWGSRRALRRRDLSA